MSIESNARYSDYAFGLMVVEEISGIGDLYIYDTALRISAFLNLYPEKVYLHTGTRIGAKKQRLNF